MTSTATPATPNGDWCKTALPSDPEVARHSSAFATVLCGATHDGANVHVIILHLSPHRGIMRIMQDVFFCVWKNP